MPGRSPATCRRAERRAAATLAAWLAVAAPGDVGAQDLVQLAAASADLSILAVTYEGRPLAGLAYALREGNELLLDVETLARLGISHDVSTARTVDGRTLVPLSSIRGLRWHIVETEQKLALSVDPDARPHSDIPFALTMAPRPLTPDWGGFVNYGVFSSPAVEDTRITGAGNTLGGSIAASVFGPYGVGNSAMLINSQRATEAGSDKVTFLDTNWRWDDLNALTSVVVGDSIAAPGWWGQAVRFGGVQVSSNYTLQPGFVTYPLMAVGGIATVPTTADILVNDIRIGSQNVPSGPFSITNIPTMTGAGELNLVVRDAFGQPRVISQPFYIAQQLLRPGLTEFSASAGAQRLNYGLRNFDYGPAYASGYVRHGLTPTLTGEARAEVDRDVSVAGAGIDLLVRQLGVVSAGAAFSQTGGRHGARYLLGFDRQGRQVSFGARMTRATREYAEIGQPIPRISSTSTAFFRTNLGDLGSLGLGYTGFRYFAAPHVNVYTASFSRPLIARSYLTLSFTRYTSTVEQTQALALVTIPLGPLTSATVSGLTTRSNATVHHQAEGLLQRSLPVGEGYGYYLRGNTDRLLSGGVSYAANFGRYSLEASEAAGTTALRAAATGAIAWVGTNLVVAQAIEQGFAVVRVGELDGVRVLQENQEVGRTASGSLALAQIPPLNPVKIAIDPVSVPIDVSVDRVVQEVVLLPRTGVLVDFRAARERSALVKVVLPTGSAVPVGATVTMKGRTEQYAVGFDGEAYLTRLADRQEVTVRFNGSTCTFVLQLEGGESHSIVGPLICRPLPATRGTP